MILIKNVCIALADGFEEIEGLTVVDLLRRAGIEVTTAAVCGKTQVTGSHRITVLADTLIENVDFDKMDMFVLPGGMPGTKNLQASTVVCKTLKKMIADGKEIAAICAAPSVLGGLHLLNGKKAACYPGFEDALLGAEVIFDEVAVDQQVITSRGLGTAIPFALALIERLLDKKTADEIGRSVIYTSAV